MSDRFPEFEFQALDSNGDPISGAKLNFYIEGTSTRKDTYSDSAKTTQNANPVVADSAGRFGDIFMDLDAGYKVVLTDSADVVIKTRDNVYPTRANPVPSIPTSAKTTNYTVLTTDKGFIILVDASSGAVTVTLPAAATAADGFYVKVKKTDSSENTVTVDGDGGETIDGMTTFVLGQQYAAAEFVTNETAWHVSAEGRNAQSRAVSKSSGYTVAPGDQRKTFVCTGTFTLALTAAATLGNGFMFWVRNDGTGTVTVDPNGAETIDGAPTLALTAGTSIRIVCDGSNFKTTGGGADLSMAKAPPEISNGTDTTNDIDIAVGKCRDDDDTANLEVTTAIGKQIDVSWAAGGTPGAPTGGLSSSLTLTNDTWYHVILGLVSGVVEVGFDTSITGANLVTDHSFTNTRRIGSVRRGTATNLAFVQIGDRFMWVTPSLQVTAAAMSTGSSTLRTLLVPLGLSVEAEFNWHTSSGIGGSGTHLYFRHPGTTDSAPSNTAAPLHSSSATIGNAATNHSSGGSQRTFTNTSSQIAERSTSSGNINIATISYLDRRGRDG